MKTSASDIQTPIGGFKEKNNAVFQRIQK